MLSQQHGAQPGHRARCIGPRIAVMQPALNTQNCPGFPADPAPAFPYIAATGIAPLRRLFGSVDGRGLVSDASVKSSDGKAGQLSVHQCHLEIVQHTTQASGSFPMSAVQSQFMTPSQLRDWADSAHKIDGKFAAMHIEVLRVIARRVTPLSEHAMAGLNARGPGIGQANFARIVPRVGVRHGMDTNKNEQTMFSDRD
jgi:hypothetical protein